MKVEGLESAPPISMVGDVYALLLTGEDTGGAFALIHAIVPDANGPPWHTHTREDETFHVLEGEITFFREGREIAAGPGTTIHLERGVEHRFENRSGATARMLIQVTPAGFERMVVEAGTPLAPGATEPAPVGEDDVPRLLAACESAGIAIRG